MVDDIRYALRLMARQKVFTIAAIATLALGIGANVTVFSIVYGVLLRPLPYRNAERVVRVAEAHPGGTPIVRVPMLSNVTFHAWRSRLATVEELAAYTNNIFTLVDRGAAVRVRGNQVSPALFRLLGAQPGMGRLLRDDDVRTGASRVVVLSTGLWRSRFGSEPSIIGRAITIDGQPHTVVGVAQPDFYFPNRDAQFWIPLDVPNTPAADRMRIFATLALLRPGVTPEQAAAEGTSAARSAGKRHLSANLLFGTGGAPTVSARPLIHEITAQVRPALLVLLASVGLVLLIACANVANLLLSRGVVRRRELAVRAAIGAGQGRLARQLMTEALVLSIAGGAIGVAVGWALTRAIPALAPEDFPRLADIHLDNMALAFAAGMTTISGVLAGILPVLRDTRAGLVAPLREGSGASTSARARLLGGGLLAAEAAFAVILMVGAGLLGRSFVRLLTVDPGFSAENVVMARIHVEGDAGAKDRERTFANALLERVRVLPGVVAAGVSNMAPFAPMTAVGQVTLRGDASEPITVRALGYVITPGYGEALSMRVRDGRLFSEHDMSAGIRPMIINEEFGRAHFNDGKPIVGRRFATSFGGNVQVEIIGVVATVLKDGLDARPQAEMYNLPRDTFGFPSDLHVAIRTAGDPAAMIPALREIVRDVDATAGVDTVETLGNQLRASVSEPRFAMTVLVALAGLALMLAAVGLYGVMSYQVSQRRREIGVRAALGATRGSIVGLVLREGIAVVTVGLVIGLVTAVWLVNLIQGLLFGITPHDPVVFGTVPVVLLIVAIIATLVPARRAAAVDPIETLRAE